MHIGVGAIGLGIGGRSATSDSAADPLATIGALTRPDAGARTVTGAADGTYQTYWNITGGVLKRNAVAGTPTPGTFSAGGVTITVLADAYDVGDGEAQAVINLGSAALSGKQIRVLPGKDACGTSVGSLLDIPSTVTLATELLITSVDMANPGYLRRISEAQTGTVHYYGVIIRDSWKTGDYPFSGILTRNSVSTGAAHNLGTTLDCVEMYSDAVTSADLAPAAVSSVTSGRYYRVASVASGNWSSIGGPASGTVIGDLFMCNSTNANISALGTVYPFPNSLRLVNTGGLGTNQTMTFEARDSYFHDAEWALAVNRNTSIDIRRCKFEKLYGDNIHFAPGGDETKVEIDDNLFFTQVGNIATTLDVHADRIQANLGQLTVDVTVPWKIRRNRFWEKDSSGPAQNIFIENPPGSAKVAAEITDNIIHGSTSHGITIENPGAGVLVARNALIWNSDNPGGGSALAPIILLDTEQGSGIVRDNVVRDVSCTSGLARERNNIEFVTTSTAAQDDYITGPTFGANDFATLAAWTAAMRGLVGSAADTAYPKVGSWASYVTFDASSPPAYSKSGLGAGSTTEPTVLVPAAFSSGQWAATAQDVSILVDVSALPTDNGGVITAIQYTTDGSSWTNSGITAPGSCTITGLTNGVSYPVQLRAVNSAGNGTASDTKSRTPVNTYAAAPALLSSGAGKRFNSFTAGTGADGKKALMACSLYYPSAWAAGYRPFIQFMSAGGNDRLAFGAQSSGRFSFTAYNASDAAIVNFLSSGSGTGLFAADTGYDIACAFDTATSTLQVYRRVWGGAWEAVAAGTNTITADGVIGSIGRCYLTDNGAGFELSDVFATAAETLDLSNATNRDKFLGTAGKGTNGSVPTGTSPPLFLSGSVAAWLNNKGTGGGLGSLDAGTITAGSNVPS